MDYRSVVLAVRDMERSKKFYTKLFGQKIELDFGENVVFDGGFSIQEGFGRLTGIPEVQWGADMELYFETEDFEAATAEIAAWPGIRYVHPLKTHDWGQRVLRIFDPDGHIVEVGERMDTVISRFLTEGHSIEETARMTQHPVDWVLRVRHEMEEPDSD